MAMRVQEWSFISIQSQRSLEIRTRADVGVMEEEPVEEVEMLEIVIIHMMASLILAKRETKGTNSGSKVKVEKSIGHMRLQRSSVRLIKARRLMAYQQKCRSLKSLCQMKSHLELLAL